MGPNALPSNDDRIREIAAILAAGVVRLRCRAALPGPCPAGPQILPETTPNCLELSDDPRLSVHTG
jgi:hypothetical protein